jgi:predicted transcriptional regulator
MSDSLGLETRKKIYSFIEENPGVHLSQIAEILKMSAQLIDYHLSYLERYDLVSVVKEAGYKRCYIKGTLGSGEKEVLSLLRQEIPLKIVLYLLKNPHSRYVDILKFVDVTSPRFSYHLNKLIKHEVIETVSVPDAERKRYIVKNKKEIIKLLIRYKPSNVLKMIKDTWVDFGPG